MMKTILRYLFILVISTGAILFEERSGFSLYKIEQTSPQKTPTQFSISGIFNANPSAIAPAFIVSNSKNLQSALLNYYSLLATTSLSPQNQAIFDCGQAFIICSQHFRSRTLSSEDHFISIS